MTTNNAVNTSLSGQTGTGSFVGSTSATLVTPALGTPTSGTLTNCTGLPVAGGGTGNSSFTAYTVICAGTTSTGSFQNVSGLGSSGQILTSNGASALPTWQTNAASGTVNSGTANQLAYYATTGTAVSGLATANSAALVTNSSGVPAWSGTMTNGQLIIGSTSATPTAATLTQGTGITITNGAGSITVASTGVGSLVWNDVSGTTQAAAVNQGYIISNASQTTVTLPATSAEGSTFAIAGKGAAGWILQANTGQVIHYGSSPTSSAGSLTSTNQWDSVTIVCVTANTTFSVIASQGVLTIA